MAPKSARQEKRDALSPQARAHDRQASLNWKRRQRGVCELCGAETRYAGKKGRRTSRLCKACGLIESGDLARRSLGHRGYRQLELSELLREAGMPLQFSVIRDCLGISSHHASALLHQSRRNGLVTRVGRGLYVLKEDEWIDR